MTAGRVHGAFGVRGWVRVESFTEIELDLLEYGPWLIGNREYTVAEGKAHGRGLVVRLEGLDDREVAHSLKGTDIRVPESNLPDVDDGGYYWRDLIGLKVVNETGVELGTVESMMETGSNDVIVVAGDRERLLPWTDETVTRVAIDEGLIEVIWDPEF